MLNQRRKKLIIEAPHLEIVEPEPVIVTSASASSLWIVLVCVFIGAIAVAAIIACYIKRKRTPPENIYAVKKNEQIPHNGVSKTLPDEECGLKSALTQRPPEIDKSSTSLISNKSGIPGGDGDVSDADSLDDDPDTTKFNEDGSFIGIYSKSTENVHASLPVI